MNDTNTDSCNTDGKLIHPAPTHQDFHWVEGPHQGTPYAEFLETVIDATSGIHSSLQIAYASTLARAANADADPGQAAAPAVGIVEADRLVRLSMVMIEYLRADAWRRMELLNEAATA